MRVKWLSLCRRKSRRVGLAERCHWRQVCLWVFGELAVICQLPLVCSVYMSIRISLSKWICALACHIHSLHLSEDQLWCDWHSFKLFDSLFVSLSVSDKQAWLNWSLWGMRGSKRVLRQILETLGRSKVWHNSEQWFHLLSASHFNRSISPSWLWLWCKKLFAQQELPVWIGASA